jgi:hypothetical protein
VAKIYIAKDTVDLVLVEEEVI